MYTQYTLWAIDSVLYDNIGIFNKKLSSKYYVFEPFVCYYNVPRNSEHKTPHRRQPVNIGYRLDKSYVANTINSCFLYFVLNPSVLTRGNNTSNFKH